MTKLTSNSENKFECYPNMPPKNFNCEKLAVMIVGYVISFTVAVNTKAIPAICFVPTLATSHN
jgi:hypothetical protein